MQVSSSTPTNDFSRKTYSLRKGSYLELVAELIPLFGYPRHLEELVIYFHSEDHLQIVLTKARLEWSWTDEAGHGASSEPIRLTGTADATSLKNKLMFFAKWGGNECEIFRLPVFTFSRAGGFNLEIRGSGLNGETATLLIGDRSEASEPLFGIPQDLIAAIEKYAHERLGPASPGHSRDTVVSRIGDQSFIDTRILEFCDSNGMLTQLNGPVKYRQVLRSKSNDYSDQAEAFSRLTGVQLLSTDRHCELWENQIVTTSVIIPCYNVDTTIVTTLESIAAQDLPEAYFQNLEVILVDDGSRFPVEKLLRGREFNFDIRVLRFGKNHGVSHARSIGVSESRGEILVFCDGDLALSRHYLRDHLVRNLVITNGLFLSFKEEVKPDDPRLTPTEIARGIDLPDYAADFRVIRPESISNTNGSQVRPLEDTNYFKAFHGSREIGAKRLTNMVHGHNCSARREAILAAAPFDRRFIGWGMEDVYFALKMISGGNFIIPVLSSGVLHIDHPPRSGSEQAKEREFRANGEIIEQILDEFG